jgi:hypothetical protein
MLQTWCQIQRTFFSLRCLNRCPGHIQFNYSYTYSGCNIQINVSALLLEICRQFSVRYTANLVPIQHTTFSLRNVYSGPGHIQCNYSSAYSYFNIQQNVFVLLLEISRQFNARYNTNLVPNTAQSVQCKLCELWSRDIQCNYSSAYAGFNIQLNVSALL